MSKILESIQRGVDGHGLYVKAIIAGERFPEVFFTDPPLADVVKHLKGRGVDVPDKVPYSDYTKESPAYVAHAGFGTGMINGKVRMHFDVSKGELIVECPEEPQATQKKSGLGL